jgi:hypothetical protein
VAGTKDASGYGAGGAGSVRLNSLRTT